MCRRSSPWYLARVVSARSLRVSSRLPGVVAEELFAEAGVDPGAPAGVGLLAASQALASALVAKVTWAVTQRPPTGTGPVPYPSFRCCRRCAEPWLETSRSGKNWEERHVTGVLNRAEPYRNGHVRAR